MKSIKHIVFYGLFAVLLAGACAKEDKLDIDIANYDIFEPGPIDDWIKTNLTDPYNIDVVYRYQRTMHDLDRNVSPPDESKVIPQMSVMDVGFLKLYEKVGGSTFIKTYTPKQFVLFGSGNYRPDGVVVAGTADAGRRITLYGLNGLDTTNAGSIMGNLGVVHHEFVHILNQIRIIPSSFEEISRGDYYANWTNDEENSEDISRSLGFISQYARQNVGEDFAETMSSLIVSGQLAYHRYAYQSGDIGYSRLLRKESVVRDYLMQHFKIDLTELQYEFANIMEKRYHSNSFSLQDALNKGYISSINLRAPDVYATDVGLSEAYSTVYSTVQSRFAGNGSPLVSAALKFPGNDPDKVTLNVVFNTQNNWNGDYDFDIVRLNNGNYKFEFSDPQGTGVTYDNARIDWVYNSAQPFIDFLLNNEFSIDYNLPGVEYTTQNYLKYVVLKSVADPDSYMVGDLISR